MSSHLTFTLKWSRFSYYLVVQKRKVRRRETHRLAQDHTAIEWPNQGFTQAVWCTAYVLSSIPWGEGGRSHLVLLAGFIKLKIPFKFLNGVVPTWQLQSRFWCPDWADEVHSLPIKCCLSQAVQDWICHLFRWQFSPTVTFAASWDVSIVVRSLPSNQELVPDPFVPQAVWP